MLPLPVNCRKIARPLLSTGTIVRIASTQLLKVETRRLLLVDDANMWPNCQPPVPAGWSEVSRTTNGIKFTVIWRKPGILDAPRDRS